MHIDVQTTLPMITRHPLSVAIRKGPIPKTDADSAQANALPGTSKIGSVYHCTVCCVYRPVVVVTVVVVVAIVSPLLHYVCV